MQRKRLHQQDGSRNGIPLLPLLVIGRTVVDPYIKDRDCLLRFLSRLTTIKPGSYPTQQRMMYKLQCTQTLKLSVLLWTLLRPIHKACLWHPRLLLSLVSICHGGLAQWARLSFQ